MPVFDNVLVTGNHLVQQNSQVNGNMSIMNDVQVIGNQTVMNDLQVNGNLSTMNDFQVVGNQTVAGSLVIGGDMIAGHRVEANQMPTVPAVLPSSQQVLFYPTGVTNQPGLLLKGTDGNNYAVFIVVSGGIPTLAIQKA